MKRNVQAFSADVRANAVFYRAELHMMRRYLALASDESIQVYAVLP